MSDFTQNKKVKTRKEHKCLGCERTYPAGSQMDYVSGVWEGEFFGYYLCKPCDTLINNNHDLRDHLHDGFSSGVVKDFCEDEGIAMTDAEGRPTEITQEQHDAVKELLTFRYGVGWYPEQIIRAHRKNPCNWAHIAKSLNGLPVEVIAWAVYQYPVIKKDMEG